MAIGGQEGAYAGAGYARPATQASQYSMPSQRVVDGYNGAIAPMPGFARSVLGNERIIFDTTYNDGTKSQFGAISENGVIKTFQQAPYQSSTVKVYVSQATVERIAHSQNPVAELKRAWGTEIRFEGLNLFSQIKFFAANIVLNIYFIFVPNAQPETIATPAPTATPATLPIPTPDIVQEEEFPFIDCQGGIGLEASGQALNGEDRDRFTNVVDNMTILRQPNGHTCTPTSGAMDLIHWNSTISPGLVNMSAQQLINDLAARMKTDSKKGTTGDNAALAIAQYISDHGFSANFTVELFYKGYGPAENRTAGSTTVQFIPVSIGVSYYELKAEVLKGQNIIVNVKFSKGGHAMKLIAINTTRSEDGTYLAAFADPETGGVVIGGLSRDGDIDIYGRQPMKISSIIAVSPKSSLAK